MAIYDMQEQVIEEYEIKHRKDRQLITVFGYPVILHLNSFSKKYKKLANYS